MILKCPGMQLASPRHHPGDYRPQPPLLAQAAAAGKQAQHLNTILDDLVVITLMAVVRHEKTHKHRLFGPVALGTAPVVCPGDKPTLSLD